MKILGVTIGLLIVLMCSISLSSCSHELEAHKIIEWQGTGGDVKRVDIQGEQWAVVWQFSPDTPMLGQYINVFNITVGTPQGQLSSIVSVANLSQVTESSYNGLGQGTYQFTINSFGGAWYLTIYEYK